MSELKSAKEIFIQYQENNIKVKTIKDIINSTIFPALSTDVQKYLKNRIEFLTQRQY